MYSKQALRKELVDHRSGEWTAKEHYSIGNEANLAVKLYSALDLHHRR